MLIVAGSNISLAKTVTIFALSSASQLFLSGWPAAGAQALAVLVLTYDMFFKPALRGWYNLAPRVPNAHAEHPPADSLLARIRGMPIEEFVTTEGLPGLPVEELRARLRRRSLGARADRCLEKSELVEVLRSHHSSSRTSCAICCEDFASTVDAAHCAEDRDDARAESARDTTSREHEAKEVAGSSAAKDEEQPDGHAAETPDVDRAAVQENEGGDRKSSCLVRLLPKCHHTFHLECIDKWAFSAPNASPRTREVAPRPPACPLCNTEM